MSENGMTEEDFKAWFAGPGTTWEQLEPWLEVEACDCGEDFCKGWSTRVKTRTT